MLAKSDIFNILLKYFSILKIKILRNVKIINWKVQL